MKAAGRQRWRRAAWRLLGAAFVVVLIVGLWSVLAEQDWTVVSAALAQRDARHIGLMSGGALLTISVGLVPGVVSWRAILLGLGPPVRDLHVVRIFFIYFLAKYLPWRGLGLIATAKAAKTAGVTLARLVSAMMLSLLVVALTGLTIGSLAGVYMLDAQVGWLMVAAALTAVVVVRPQVVDQIARLVLRLLRRPAPPGSVSARGLRLAVAAQSLSWVVSGMHLWLLAVMMGAAPARSLALCVGAFSLATAIGMLAVVVPDGIGVRESILMAALVVVLPLPSAAVVTLASRVVSTVSEVVLGAVALTAAEIAHRRALAQAPEGTGDPTSGSTRPQGGEGFPELLPEELDGGGGTKSTDRPRPIV